MAAADYYNDPRYRPAPPQPAYPQYPHYDPRPNNRPPRMDAHEDSPIEEIQREFPPGKYYDHTRPKRRSRRSKNYYPSPPPPRRARSAQGRYDDGYYDRPHRSDRHRDRDRDRDPYRSSRYDNPRRDHRSRRSYSSSPSPSPPPPRRKPKRRKSLTEQAMGAMGALGLGNALSGGHDDRRRHRSDSRGAGRRRRHRSYSSSSSPSPSRDGRVRGPGGMNQQQIAQAVKAALTAGAAEAYRARKEPGGWTGEKGKRIITAALASGGADGVIDRDPNKHSKRHIIESALAGLATNRAVNGRRSRSNSRDARGHSSRSHGGALKGIATSGALAAAGKEIYDHLRSRSRSKGRDSSVSSDDERDSRSRRHGAKKRSQSVSDYVSKGLAAVGLGDLDDRIHDKPKRRSDRRRERPSRYDSSGSGSDSGSSDSEADFRPRRRGPRGGDGNSREVGRSLQNSPPGPNPNMALSKYERAGTVGRYHPPHSLSENDSDLGSSSGEENTRKKMVRNQMLTTGFAALATVHAAHSVYGSINKRKQRMAAVREGNLDPKEAQRQRWKYNARDAASLGLAALGVHGAVEECRDATKKRAECKEFKQKAKERAEKRARMRSMSLDAGSVQRWREGVRPSYGGSE